MGKVKCVCIFIIDEQSNSDQLCFVGGGGGSIISGGGGDQIVQF